MRRSKRARRASEQVAERRQMTVMFVDMVGSTRIAEQHEPEIVRDVVRRYQAVCGRSIAKGGGHVASYAGDGVVAYFGFPAAHEHDARRAILAGLDVVAGVGDLASEIRTEHGIELATRVGIHTGLVLLAEMGAPDRPERDAIVGATPNQAARIQSVAPAGAVAISEATFEIVCGYFDVESLGRPEMKGIDDVEVFRVLRATDAADRIQAAGRALTPLVGRRRELGVLRDHWAAVARPSPPSARIVLLRGEAGIGKSRVAAETRRDALRSGGTTFVGMCAADRTTRPLYPVMRMLELHFGWGPDDDVGRKIERLEQGCEAAGLRPSEAVPVFARLLDLSSAGRHDPLELDPRALRELTFQTIVGLVLAVSNRQRVLVVVEDVHWSDQSTLELIGRLGATRPAAGLLVLTTARPDFQSPWTGERSFNLQVERLPPEDHRELIRLLADIYPLSGDFGEVIAQRSDGNPLFTEELARAVRPIADDAGPTGNIPTTIRDLLTARLDRLGDDKHLAQVAATIGREVDVELLRTVTGLSRSRMATGLAALVRAGIIEQPGRPDGAATHRFVHALVRDAAYDSQEKLHDRPAAHLDVAHALVARRHPDAGLVAQHFDAARSPVDAVRFYVLAASGAQRAAAHVEAIRLLDRALELVSSLPATPARDALEINVRILRGLSSVNLQGYAAPGAADDYRRCLDLSERVGADIELFTAAMGIWSYYIVHGDLRSAGEATARMETMRQPEIEAELLMAVGVQRFFEGRFDEAQASLAESLRAFEGRPAHAEVSPRWQLPNDPFVTTLTDLGLVLWLAGRSDEAEVMLRRACERSEALSFPTGPFSQAYAMCYAGWLANVDGRYADGLELHERTLEVSARYGFAFWTATSTCHAAVSRAHLGDPHGGLETAAGAIALWRALGAEAFVPCMQTHLAEIRLELGFVDQALGDVDQALEWATERGEHFFTAESHRIRAAILRRRGAEPEEVRGELETGRRMAAMQGAPMLELRALVDLLDLDDAGPRPGAVEDLQRLVEGLPPVTRPTRHLQRAHVLLGRARRPPGSTGP